MPRTLLLVRRQSSETPVGPSTLVGRSSCVDRRREQRMLEPHRLSLDHDHPRRLGAREPRKHLVRRGTRSRVAHSPTVGFGDAAANKSASRVEAGSRRSLAATNSRTSSGTGSASPTAGTPARKSDCGELEREERVAARRAVEPQKPRPAEGATEPSLDQLMQRTRAQPGHTDALELLAAERTIETQRHRAGHRRAQ